MTAQQRDSELIAVHEAHLRQLYLTRAQQGLQTPPHIHTEISRVEAEIDRLRPAHQPMDALTVYRALTAHIMRLDADIIGSRRLHSSEIARLSAEVANLRQLVDDFLLASVTGRAPRPRRPRSE